MRHSAAMSLQAPLVSSLAGSLHSRPYTRMLNLTSLQEDQALMYRWLANNHADDLLSVGKDRSRQLDILAMAETLEAQASAPAVNSALAAAAFPKMLAK